jgi:hypothetical protein
MYHVCGGREAYTGVWWCKPEERRPLGRPKRRWEDDIKIYLQEVGCGMDLSGSGWGQVVGICERGNEPSGSKNCGEFLDFIRTG